MDTTQANSETIGRLAAGIVHEMNSPLGALRSASDTLSRVIARMADEGDVNDRARPDRRVAAMSGSVRAIEEGAKRIGEVVGVLEQLERLINHEGSERVTVDLRTTLGGMVTRATQELGERVRVECRFDGRPTPVRCNRSRLERALSDLLRHAAGALEHGSEVTVCVERLGSHAEVWIADNGPGMSEAEVARACTLGFAPHEGRVRLHLGLLACRQAIESEGGQLHIESTPGAGTQLRVRLPIAA